MTTIALSENKRYMGVVSEGWLEGYFIGGYSSGALLQTTEVLNYSTETLTTVSTASLQVATAAMAGCHGNDAKGYLIGGEINGASLSNNISVVTYKTQTISQPSSQSLTKPLSSSAGVSEYFSRGYFAGGTETAIPVNTTNRIVFDTDSISIVTGEVLSSAKGALSSVSRTFVDTPIPVGVDGNYGYFAGGSSGVGVFTSTVDKIDYTTEAFVSTTAVLNVARDKQAGLSENVNVGYFSGGNSGTYLSSTERLTYSTDVIALVSFLDLETPADALGALSQTVSKGYFVGGFTDSEVGTITLIQFSPESRSTLTSQSLQSARSAIACIDGNSVKGYISGGSIEAGFSSRITEVFVYSVEASFGKESASLTDGKRYLSGVGNRSSKGFFAGGIGEAFDSVDTIAFSTDTTSAITSVLSVGRYALAGVNLTNSGYSNTKGFIGGGKNSTGNLTTIDKINFSTNAIGSIPAVLSVARAGLAAVSQMIVAQPNYLGSGTIFISGQALTRINVEIGTSGGIVIDGEAIVIRNFLWYITSGGVVVSGGIGNPSFIVDLPITYAIFAVVTVDLPIIYAIAQEIYYGYRIEGECLELTDCNGPFNEDNPECRKRSIVTLIARSPKEACEQLKKQNWNWPIKKFQQFTKPVYKNDEQFLIEQGLYNEACPQLQDAEFCYDPECAEFCLSYDVIENIKFTAAGILTDSAYVGSGEVLIFGKANYLTNIYGGYLHYPPVNIGSGASFGYFAGGATGSNPATSSVSSVYRITYSTNAMNAYTSESLSVARSNGVGCSGNQVKGYFIGGTTASLSSSSNIDKIDYGTGVISASGSNLLTNRSGAGSISNKDTFGYVAGGINYSSLTIFSSFEKIQISTDNVSSLAGSVLSSPSRYSVASLDGNDIKGYFCGGTTNDSVVYVTTDKFEYAVELATSLASADLTFGRYGASSCHGNFFSGYILGGYGGSGLLGSVEKMNYGVEVSSLIGTTNISRRTGYAAGISQGSTKGYISGGDTNVLVDLTYLISYATDSVEQLGISSSLSVATWQMISASPASPFVVYPIIGGPNVSGVAGVTTVNVGLTNRYTGSGTIIIGGDGLLPFNLGEQIQSSTVVMDVFYFIPYFSSTNGQSLVPLNTTSNISLCGCENMPLKFNIVTNLSTESEFTSFLRRSNLTFSPILQFYYQSNELVYSHATHLVGRNSDGSAKETWTIVGNMNCNNDLDNFDNQFVWTISLLIRRVVGNQSELTTQINIWIPQEIFCPSYVANQVQFNLQVNIKTRTVLANKRENLRNVFINDRIELFNSSAWKANPILSLISGPAT